MQKVNSVEITDSKHPSVQLVIINPSIEDLFKAQSQETDSLEIRAELAVLRTYVEN